MRSTDDCDPSGTNGNAKVAAIADACRLLATGAMDEAAVIIKARYPFNAVAKGGRSYSAAQMTRVFMRDGFVDRYTGAREPNR